MFERLPNVEMEKRDRKHKWRNSRASTNDSYWTLKIIALWPNISVSPKKNIFYNNRQKGTDFKNTFISCWPTTNAKLLLMQNRHDKFEGMLEEFDSEPGMGGAPSLVVVVFLARFAVTANIYEQFQTF